MENETKKIDKKERNSRVIKLYTDNGKNIDEVVKIIATIPELAATFHGKNVRKSCIGILNTVAGLWQKLEKPATQKKDEPTKKEMLAVFCELLGIELSDFPTLLNLRKIEIARLIVETQDRVFEDIMLDEKSLQPILKYIDKVEKGV